MSMLLSFFLLGITLSAPIGPINAAVLNTGIKRGFMPAWFLALGALAADLIYMLLVFMGFVHFMSVPFVKSFLWLFGAFVLIYTGVESLIGIRNLHIQANGDMNETPLLKAWTTGFFMSLANPLTILFWIGIYGSVLAEAAAKSSGDQLLVYSMAIICGVLCWDITMSGLAGFFRKILSDTFMKIIALISGISLVGFGAYFAIEAFRLLLAR
ncbi:threonine/homoserine/homoserine lactone efflux protein [Paenibacillus phyllosphaerae]|uniref:Threonine/homoserine/homoserine lactone efflux protein n=1 Tax=Paenibacillus phyllosphaerae TaxID=274593 RepID=A0A7W5AYT7_9BACL|nr:LysE family transporter [Paenibacillus phyllosphaerae]MBB3111107.1 threonine/homoserine/homoserine lactone efflux protein [Paenibacillus phyllosphaerae]